MDERRIRKRNAEQRGSVPTAPLDAARALQSALAIRRSTTAQCQWDYSSQGSTWARLRDTPAHAAGSPPAGVALPAMHLARRWLCLITPNSARVIGQTTEFLGR